MRWLDRLAGFVVNKFDLLPELRQAPTTERTGVFMNLTSAAVNSSVAVGVVGPAACPAIVVHLHVCKSQWHAARCRHHFQGSVS